MHTIVLRLDAGFAHLADERAWSPDQSVEARADGSVEVRFRAVALWPVEAEVLRRGGNVHVVEPPELVEAVRAAARRILNGNAS